MVDLKEYGIGFPIRDPILRESLIAFLEGREAKVSYLDCLEDQLQSDINANLRAGWITPEQARVLEQGGRR